MDTERIHFLTEGIYRNILDNFNPGLKELISAGRIYQKALHNVAGASKAYIDCIQGLAQSAQLCKGATNQIGGALLQIAEVQKEINIQVIDNIKCFHAELIIPIESKAETEFKMLNNIHKKYEQSHRAHTLPLKKATARLEKHKKKSKSAKYGFDQKEIQYSREVNELLGRLAQFRMDNLRQALLLERKRYCFVLERICAMLRFSAGQHRKSYELCTYRLPEWSSLSMQPYTLPAASENLLKGFLAAIRKSFPHTSAEDDGDDDDDDDDDDYVVNPHARSGVSAPSSLARGSPGQLLADDYGHVTGSERRVRALYSYQASSRTQLSLSAGDVVVLVGNRVEGWQYGQNSSSQQLGWFPASYTEPVGGGGGSGVGRQRIRSVGNLHEMASLEESRRSLELAERPLSMTFGPQVTGNVERGDGVYETARSGPEGVYAVSPAQSSSGYSSGSQRVQPPLPPPPPPQHIVPPPPPGSTDYEEDIYNNYNR